MALQKTNGEYITVEEIRENTVNIRVHANAEHRKRYKEGTETSFETTRQENRTVELDLTKTANGEETIKNNVTIEGYTALKRLEEFKEATSV